VVFSEYLNFTYLARRIQQPIPKVRILNSYELDSNKKSINKEESQDLLKLVKGLWIFEFVIVKLIARPGKQAIISSFHFWAHCFLE